jgi:hypothetical protein
MNVDHSINFILLNHNMFRPFLLGHHQVIAKSVKVLF